MQGYGYAIWDNEVHQISKSGDLGVAGYYTYLIIVVIIYEIKISHIIHEKLQIKNIIILLKKYCLNKRHIS